MNKQIRAVSLLAGLMFLALMVNLTAVSYTHLTLPTKA